eukprot:681759-Pelagomonas_calceolata.AAC.2
MTFILKRKGRQASGKGPTRRLRGCGSCMSRLCVQGINHVIGLCTTRIAAAIIADASCLVSNAALSGRTEQESSKKGKGRIAVPAYEGSVTEAEKGGSWVAA